MATTKVSIKDGKIIIELPIVANVPVTSTGKSRKLAGTVGFESAGIEFRGCEVKINVNAIVPLECPTEDKKEAKKK